jgi:carbamoyl-phosphate synthase large subunit
MNAAIKVLVTSAARKVWLIQAFKKALREAGGGSVVAGDINPYSAALYLADERVILKRDDDPELEDWLFDYCSKARVSLIIPTRDEELPLYSGFAGRFLENGIRVLVSNQGAVGICQDKRRFIEYCAENGFHTPRTYDSPDQIESRDFPLFLKERFGKGGVGSYVAADRQELDVALKKMKEPIIQHLVKATEYSIDLLSDFDGEVLSAIPRERKVVVSGESYVTITRKDPGMIADAVRLSESLGLIGHNTVQCFSSQGRNEFVEVNPRFGGAASLGFAAGCDSPRLIVDMVRGIKIEPFLGEFKENLVMLRYTQDHILPQESLEHVPDD